MRACLIAAVCAALGCRLTGTEFPPETVLADFGNPSHGWRARNHAFNGRQTATGYAYDVNGDDPWLVGPQVTIPPPPQGAVLMRFTLETASCPSGSFEMFWAGPGERFDPVRVVQFVRIDDSRYVAEVHVGVIPPKRVHLRLDSPSARQCPSVEIRRLRLSYHTPLWRSAFSAPASFDLGLAPLELRGDGWRLLHSREKTGAFRLEAGGKTWAEGHPLESIVVMGKDGKPERLDAARGRFEIRKEGESLSASLDLADGACRAWRFERRFFSAGDSVRIRTSVLCDSPAQVLHLPWLTLCVDRASGGRKAQALFHGVEYLADEPSSNEKEIRGPAANRIMPAATKLCSPLMLLSDGRDWLAMRWRENFGIAAFSPVFDTPDRLFGTGGHLFALWSPTVGKCRRESEFDIYAPMDGFTHGECEATLTVGRGHSVAAALERLFPQERLPPVPDFDVQEAISLLACGWLDSGIRDGLKIRHAMGLPQFGAELVSDAPAFILYLAAMTSDSALSGRLTRIADAMIAAFPKDGALRQGCGRTVSHVNRPAAPLVYGDPFAYMRRRQKRIAAAAAALSYGKRIWQPQKDKIDYGETLDDNHCNGYSAMEAAAMMHAALWSGNKHAIADALFAARRLLNLYRDTVPCGAQPWEMPLHSPDIVAAGHLAGLAADAFMLSGDPWFLDAARPWAWSGLSMVYLRDPGLGFCGSYATTGVLGATRWKAPNWIGRPVQWCGLVYAAAIDDYAALLEGREANYWRQIVRGIAVSGLAQTYPRNGTPEQGLLPDSTVMATQERMYVPINPGTLEACLAPFLGKPYYRCMRACDGEGGVPIVHVAGDAKVCRPETGEMLRIVVDPWPKRPCRIFLTRLPCPKVVTVDGRSAPFEWDDGCLSVSVPGGAVSTVSVWGLDADL